MIRWGLLGTAHINRRLIPALRAARRSTLVAVASRDATRVRAYAQEWQIAVAHASYDALLRDPAVDAVYIPLPNSLHVEWTLRALDAGKHVLCEKPLALSPDDVDRVEAVARAADRVVEEAFMFRHEPLTHTLLQLISDGVIGRLTLICSGFTFEQSRENDVRLVPALGGGSLWDIGCYCVNVTRLVAGCEPVEAFGWATNGASGVDESFSGILRFPTGVTATIHSGFRSSYRTWLEVHGKDGVLRLSEPFRPAQSSHIEVRRVDEPAQMVTVEGSAVLFVRLIEDFAATALGDRDAIVPLSDSRGNAATLCALYASAAASRAMAI